MVSPTTRSKTMRHMRIAYAMATILLTIATATNAAHGAEATNPKQIPYKQLPDGESLKLHLFASTASPPEGGRTAIVFFFGGGWVGGRPNQFYPQCRHYAARGMVAIAAEYRVHSRHKSTIAQSVADAKSAIRYVREHAAELGVNPDKIISSGGSAGGHLAACTGVLESYDEASENKAISSQPNAMILLNPVVDTTPLGYLGKLLPKKGDRSLSPVHHVRPGLPPTLICHGTADKTVSHENAVRFEKAMVDAGNRCELKSYDGAGHGFFNPRHEANYHAVVAHMDTFIDSLGW
jgi:acetyl esterase